MRLALIHADTRDAAPARQGEPFGAVGFHEQSLDDSAIIQCRQALHGLCQDRGLPFSGSYKDW
jgi:hypothetical protein